MSLKELTRFELLFWGAVGLLLFVPVDLSVKQTLFLLLCIALVWSSYINKLPFQDAIWIVLGCELLIKISQIGFFWEMTKLLGLFVFLPLLFTSPVAIFRVLIVLVLIYAGYLVNPILAPIKATFSNYTLSWVLAAVFSSYQKPLVPKAFNLIIPVIYTLLFVFLNHFDISQQAIGSGRFSNNGVSGFSANQTTNYIGALLLFFVFMSYRWKYNAWVFALFVVYFLLAFLTLSRGGVVSFILATLFFYIIKTQNISALFVRLGLFVLSGFFIWGVFLEQSTLLSNAVSIRYTGYDLSGELRQDDLSTGRTQISDRDLNTFFNNPIFGVGLGNSSFLFNKSLFTTTTPSHSEFMRLLSEHGLLGVLLFCLFIKWVWPSPRSPSPYFLASLLFFTLYSYQGSSRLVLPIMLVVFTSRYLFFFVKNQRREEL